MKQGKYGYFFVLSVLVHEQKSIVSPDGYNNDHRKQVKERKELYAQHGLKLVVTAAGECRQNRKV